MELGHGYICNLCKTESRRLDLKKAKHLEFDHRLGDLHKKILFDPNFIKKNGPTRCAVCHSRTTYKRNDRGGRLEWYKFGEDSVQCARCYNKQFKTPPKTGGLLRAWQRALKASMLFPKPRKPRKPPKPPEAPKRCAECGSYNTSKNLKGAPNWYRLEVPMGPIGYLDNNCYRRRERRLKREAKGLRLLISRKGETHSEKRARINALRRAQRRTLKPEEPPEPPR
jgi:hypothetical protein